MGKFLLTLLLSTSLAQAFTPTRSPSGKLISWRGARYLPLAGNPINRSGIGSQYFFDSVARALQKWQKAAQGAVKFDYWQGTNPSTYEPNSELNGLSSIYFASNGNVQMEPGLIGLTEVWYDTDTGKILETDIVLNDINFNFKSDERATSGTGSVTPVPGVFIESVITHELGHAFGISHSPELKSTMLFVEGPDQAHLSCDDQVGIRALYVQSPAQSALVGRVQTSTGSGIFGAQVMAISQKRGTVLGSTLTDTDGTYRINALEPGTYYVMAEPYYPGPSPLSSYFQSINSFVCSGNTLFSRTFLRNGMNLVGVTVLANQAGSVPTITVSCNGGGAAVSGPNGGSSRFSATVVSRAGASFGVVDRVGVGSQYYALEDFAGDLEIHSLSYGLYSPIRTVVELQDSVGRPIQTSVDAYSSQSGFKIYDQVLVAQNLPPGDYFLRIEGFSLAASLYPASNVSMDTESFTVLTGAANQPSPSAYPHNGKCRMTENFGVYASPPGGPPRRSDDGIFGCGTVHRVGPPPPPSGGQVAGFLLPWLGCMAALLFTRRRARKQRLALGARSVIGSV